jgi:glycosyltransferase involved in cell wall biosynthesis
LSFFFPVLNEEEHVRPLVARALEVLPGFAERFEVIIVDDGSSDRSGAYADELARRDPRVRVVHHPMRRGYGGAIRSGFAASRHALVFFTDGDRQFDPADLALLLPELDGADAVVGYRIKRSDPWRRRFVGWCYNRAIRVLFGLPIRDVDCAFKLLRREVFVRVPLDLVRSNGAFFSAELLIRMHQSGLRMRQVGVPHHPRAWGEAKGAPPRVILRAIRDLLVLRWSLSRRDPRNVSPSDR